MRTTVSTRIILHVITVTLLSLTTVHGGRTISGNYNTKVSPYDTFPRLPDPSFLPTHPRLVWTDAQVYETVQLLTNSSNTDIQNLYSNVIAHGNELLADSSMMTGLWDYVYTLGGLHRIECMLTNQSLPLCTTNWSQGGIPFLLRTANQSDSCGDCPNNNCTNLSFFLNVPLVYVTQR